MKSDRSGLQREDRWKGDEERDSGRRSVREVQVEVRYGLLHVYRSDVRANYRLYF